MTQAFPEANRAAANPLQGLRVLVTAFDLEQSEHRGIAVYSKGLLKALRQAGAEVWLLTQFDPSMEDVRACRQPNSTSQMIFAARLLDSLNNGRLVDTPRGPAHSRLASMPILKQVQALRVKFNNLMLRIFPKRLYKESDFKLFSLQSLFDNPYLQSERLGYLKDVSGLVCADQIFANSCRLALQRPGHVLWMNLKRFDGLITTCPLNLRVKNARFSIQTVHDLIPVEYAQTSDDPIAFVRRLRACAYSAKIFISHSTQYKYQQVIQQPANAGRRASCIVTQSPSLRFPADACLWEAKTTETTVYSEAKRRLQLLKPCGFLLFNSSVEPRKNLLFVVKAFLESGIERQGIKLCVTGKLKADAYSDEVKRLTEGHPHILLAGYVDEATKRQLFLNALAIVSPSLVEGFGIPVLDGACLGVPVIASLSDSHREIQQLFDFEQHVLLCSTLETSDWASAIRLIVGRMDRLRLAAMAESPEELRSAHEQLWLDGLRQERIRRYQQKQQQIDAEFQAALCSLIRAELPGHVPVNREEGQPLGLAAAAIKARI